MNSYMCDGRGSDCQEHSLLQRDALQCGKSVPTLWRSLLPLSSTPKMRAAGSVKTSVTTYRNAQHHIAKDRSQNLKCCMLTC